MLTAAPSHPAANATRETPLSDCEAPEAVLILTGCAARLVASFVPRKHAPVPSADLIIVPEHKDLLTDPDYIGKLLDAAAEFRERRNPRNDALRDIEGSALPGPMPKVIPGTRAYPKLEIRGYRRVRPVLKVEDGCTHRCTYCIVPQTRGMYVSRSPEETSAEADRLFRDHAEIMISGINLGQYGRNGAPSGICSPISKKSWLLHGPGAAASG